MAPKRGRGAKKTSLIYQPDSPVQTPDLPTKTVPGANSEDERQLELFMQMCFIMRVEINTAVDTLQPQLTAIQADLKECNVKLRRLSNHPQAWRIGLHHWRNQTNFF